MSTLVLATHNQGKLNEFRTLLAPLGFEVKSAGELNLPEPEETGTTFEANATLKAEAAAQASGLPALADDSGLVIPALNNAPGIYSARWAPDKNFNVAFERIKSELTEAGAPLNTPAYFMCVLAFYSPPLEGGAGGGVAATRHYPSFHIPLAKLLRKSSTNAERKLWYRIRNYQIANAKFRRQHPIGPYIADFVCTEHQLIIELDGGQHNETSHQQKDKIRDQFFEEAGYRVLRFWNNEVMENVDGVLEVILTTLESPLPLREGRGRGSSDKPNASVCGTNPSPNPSLKGRGITHLFTGRIDGTLTFPPRGTNGFGYDPIFIPEGHTETFAELPATTKNALSHRARAFEELVGFLKLRNQSTEEND